MSTKSIMDLNKKLYDINNSKSDIPKITFAIDIRFDNLFNEFIQYSNSP